jgi:hemerythrin-like domain-containing protein
MGRTQLYREQHREISRVVADLAPLLEAAALKKDATPAFGRLMDLAGRLRVHLTLEDRTLYPELLLHRNPDVRALARLYRDEMGGIYGDLEGLLHAWHSPETIAADPGRFVREVKAFLQVLARRVEREDGELYPLVDRVDSTPS